MAKYVVEWYHPIGLFNKQTYIVPVNPVVIIFFHLQYRICPLKQDLFGWFIYRDFLTATCWNNRSVRVDSATGKTVHKLFVGGVCYTDELLSLWLSSTIHIHSCCLILTHPCDIMPSWYGNTFYITGPLWRESISHWYSTSSRKLTINIHNMVDRNKLMIGVCIVWACCLRMGGCVRDAFWYITGLRLQ